MIDQYLTRRRRKGYDCSDFAAEVAGVPTEAVKGALSARSGWRPSRVPQEGGLVLLRRNTGNPHVGIYTKGGVLHLGERGALFQPLHFLKRDFNKIRYYAKCNDHN